MLCWCGDEGRPAPADGNRSEVGIPTQAKRQCQSRFHAELVVDIRVDQPSLDVGQLARSLLEAAHVTQQPVRHAVAGVVAAEADDARRPDSWLRLRPPFGAADRCRLKSCAGGRS